MARRPRLQKCQLLAHGSQRAISLDPIQESYWVFFYLHNNELSARVRLTFMLASTLNSLSNSGGFMSDRPIEADELEEETKVKPDEHEKDDESLAPESGDKQPD
jgi:hypothetical protein